IGVNQSRARRGGAITIEAFRLDRVPYRIGMQIERCGNGADFPVFSEEKLANLGNQGSRDHLSLPFRKRIEKTPAPATQMANHKPATQAFAGSRGKLNCCKSSRARPVQSWQVRRVHRA